MKSFSKQFPPGDDAVTTPLHQPPALPHHFADKLHYSRLMGIGQMLWLGALSFVSMSLVNRSQPDTPAGDRAGLSYRFNYKRARCRRQIKRRFSALVMLHRFLAIVISIAMPNPSGLSKHQTTRGGDGVLLAISLSGWGKSSITPTEPQFGIIITCCIKTQKCRNADASPI